MSKDGFMFDDTFKQFEELMKRTSEDLKLAEEKLRREGWVIESPDDRSYQLSVRVIDDMFYYSYISSKTNILVCEKLYKVDTSTLNLVGLQYLKKFLHEYDGRLFAKLRVASSRKEKDDLIKIIKLEQAKYYETCEEIKNKNTTKKLKKK